ncbi:hypothetical protein D3C84_644570 [compost metagenome]
MGQFDFHPTQQSIGFVGDTFPCQVTMVAEHRQQVTGGVATGTLQHLGTATGRCLVEHAGTGMRQIVAIRAEKRHCAYVRLLQGLGGDTLQLSRVVADQGRCHQGGEVFGDHFAALQQLGLQLALLQPGEIAAEHQRHQAGR